MLKRLSSILAVLSFIPWIIGSVESPDLQPLSGWMSWTLMVLAMALITKFTIWKIFFIGDIVVIASILLSGGRNFAFYENIIPLFLGLVMFVVSISRLKLTYPLICEILGSLALLSGYYPLWLVHINKVVNTPIGMIIAMMLGITAYFLLFVDDSINKRFSPSNIIALIFMIITLVCMLH